MTYTYYRSLKASIAPFALVCPLFAVLLLATAPAFGQSAAAPGFVIDDWTHHHLVFSNPGSADDALRSGTFDKWARIVTDSRYQMQQLKRSSIQRALTAAPDLQTQMNILRGLPEKPDPGKRNPLPTPRDSIVKDWSAGLDGADESATVTVGTVNSSNISSSSTLTIGTTTLTASVPTASAAGTFTGAPTVGQTATITNGSNVLVLTAGNSTGQGTDAVTYSSSMVGTTVTIGGTTYTWESSVGTTANQVLVVTTASGSTRNARNAQNLEAAINNNSSQCYASPCFGSSTVANASATATVSSATVTVTNTTSGNITFSTSNTAYDTLSPATGPLPPLGSNNCKSSTAGAFLQSSTLGTDATNLAATITACNTSDSAVGVTATAAAGVVTVTAAAAGTGGNSIGLAETLSNFTWSGTQLTGGGTDGTTSGTTFSGWAANTYVSSAALATNIATSINSNPTLQGSAGVTATVSGAVVTVTSRATGTTSIAFTKASFGALTLSASTLGGGATGVGTVQPNAFPAKYGSLTAASCSDFVVYPTGKAGSGTAASIVAFDNLYTAGCTGAVPSVNWAYNTGGTVTTSPVLSADGSQVAFVQASGTTASLVLLHWSSSTGGSVGSPATLTTQSSASAYRTCTAPPCMYTMAFSGSHNDTFSAPFYDYQNDMLYVGDDSGNLHKFTGVFNGTPGELGTPWPVNLSTTNKLSSPVYDSGSTHVFVGDMGGYLYYVTSDGSTHSPATGGLAGKSLGNAIADAPLVDSTTGQVFAFVGYSGTYSESTLSAVYGNNTNLNAPYPGVAPLANQAGNTAFYLYSGGFDNVYYQSSTHTGHIYVVANLGATASLYQVGVSGALTGAATAVATGLTAGSYSWPSPVTEFCSGACTSDGTKTTAGTDYVFFSVNQGAVGGCTSTAGNGCILAYNISNPASVVISNSGLNVTTPATNGCWATGGLVIDNSDTTTTGASQIYFVNLNGSAAGGPAGNTSSGCTGSASATINATQASQSAP